MVKIIKILNTNGAKIIQLISNNMWNELIAFLTRKSKNNAHCVLISSGKVFSRLLVVKMLSVSGHEVSHVKKKMHSIDDDADFDV